MKLLSQIIADAAALTLIPWEGLTGGAPDAADASDPSTAREIRQYRPHLDHPWEIAGKIQPDQYPRRAFFELIDATSNTWRINPMAEVYPGFYPDWAGTSQFSRPLYKAIPGDKFFLRSTWDITAGPPISYKNKSSAYLVSRQDLSADNDFSLISGQTVRTWHHLVGGVNAAGVPVIDPFYIPPQLT